jgi:hypothetical protein
MWKEQVPPLNEEMMGLEALGVAVIRPWEGAVTSHDHELGKTPTETLHFQ